MFSRLGSWCGRYRWAVVAAWVVTAILLSVLAPDINKVAVNDQRAFLPTGVPSLQAAQLLRAHFPERMSSNSAVGVVDAGPGHKVTTGPAWEYVEQLTTRFQALVGEGTLSRVVSPAAADEQTAKALISPDGQVAIVIVSFAEAVAGDEGNARVAHAEAQLNPAPTGVSAYLTGDAAVLAAYDHAARSSVDSTTWLTILLVVVILLIVYRSPVSPLIPLFTIGLAYLISRGVIALLGAHWWTISGYTNVFIIVVLFGAGTDYCLFLISRFREEMAVDHSTLPAVARTVGAVGETITSSAATVIVGLSTMAFAELGLYNASGPSVAIAVLIALVAGLTLTPALLAILGDKAFWPRRARRFTEGGFWSWWSNWVTRHPVWVLAVVVALLAPLAVYGQGLKRDFDLVADLSSDTPAVRGFNTLATHLDAGATSPLTALLRDPAGFDTPAGLARLAQMEAKIATAANVGQVTGFTSLLAESGTLRVHDQLSGLVGLVRRGEEQLRSTGGGASISEQALQEAADGLVELGMYLRQLAVEYPEIIRNPGFIESVEALTTLATVAGMDAPMFGVGGALGQDDATTDAPSMSAGVTVGGPVDPSAVVPQLARLTHGLETLGHNFASHPDSLMLPHIYLEQNEGLRALTQAYLSPDKTVARISVILTVGPYTDAAMDTVRQLRNVVEQGSSPGLLDGTSAIMTDLREASGRDMTRALVSVLLGIMLVLVWLLRSLVAPVYLLATILLSYLSTLGIVRLVFSDLLRAPGITWWVPMFMFVMLVALGMDYNIFLMGRVKEEVAALGNLSGIPRAVTRTGAIITSAGIIVAGTFSAMMSADILGLVQIGFAVTVGILLDTFVVRTALVPAIAVLLGRWSWWPRLRALKG